jgi:hypothetical protein
MLTGNEQRDRQTSMIHIKELRKTVRSKERKSKGGAPGDPAVQRTSVRSISRQFGRVQHPAVEYHLRDPGIGVDRLRRILFQ